MATCPLASFSTIFDGVPSRTSSNSVNRWDGLRSLQSGARCRPGAGLGGSPSGLLPGLVEPAVVPGSRRV
jgi:hypothetical protein